MSRLINITDQSNATAPWCEDQDVTFIFWSCTAVFSFVVGCPTAVAILLDMIQKGRKGTSFTPIDVFVSNLAVMDGLYLFFLPLEVYNSHHGFNPVYDIFIFFLFSFILCGRPLFTVCISLDCYLAVVHPVTYRTRKSLTPRVLMAAGVWTVTLTYGLYYVFRFGEIPTDITQILFYALTLPVIGFCDISTVWTLRRSKPGGGDVHPLKKKALQIIISNLVVTFTSFLPPTIIILVLHFGSLDVETMYCLLNIPVFCIPFVGITLPHMLHLDNLGKLDWLKCWKHK